MRKLLIVLLMTAAASACSADVFGTTTFKEADLLTGTWQGEAAGFKITLAIDTGMCLYGCSNTGRGAWKTVASRDTGSFFVTVGIAPLSVNNPLEVDYMGFGFASAAPVTVMFDYQMPDSSHLTGRIHANGQPADSTLRPLLPVDSSFAITLSKVR